MGPKPKPEGLIHFRTNIAIDLSAASWTRLSADEV